VLWRGGAVFRHETTKNTRLSSLESLLRCGDGSLLLIFTKFSHDINRQSHRPETSDETRKNLDQTSIYLSATNWLQRTGMRPTTSQRSKPPGLPARVPPNKKKKGQFVSEGTSSPTLKLGARRAVVSVSSHSSSVTVTATQL
jgi:hypothetical protein